MHWNRNYFTVTVKTIIGISKYRTAKMLEKKTARNIKWWTAKNQNLFQNFVHISRKNGFDKDDFTFLNTKKHISMEKENKKYSAVIHGAVWLKNQKEKFRWKLGTKFLSHSQVNTLILSWPRQQQQFSLGFDCVRPNDDGKKNAYLLLLLAFVLYYAAIFFSVNFRLSFLYFGLVLFISGEW